MASHLAKNFIQMISFNSLSGLMTYIIAMASTDTELHVQTIGANSKGYRIFRTVASLVEAAH